MIWGEKMRKFWGSDFRATLVKNKTLNIFAASTAIYKQLKQQSAN
jgi:hypothetical protein